MFQRSLLRLGVATCVAVLAACTYQPGDVANPLTRKFTWFSYVAGDDLRSGCHSGAPDRFRIIYNGDWDEQVRIYELGLSGPRTLDERVIVAGQLGEISFSDPLAPWRGKSASVVLRDEEYQALVRDLADSGAYHSPVDTLTLAARDYYWLAASCRDGVFHLTAWLYPSEAFDRISFATWLGALDRTGIPFNSPVPWNGQVSNRSASTELPAGSTGTTARGLRPPASWSIGIAQDRMVDRLEF